MAQLTLSEIDDDIPRLGEPKATAIYRALNAIAGSTLIEFDGALAWGQWCRRTAAGALRTTVEAELFQPTELTA